MDQQHEQQNEQVWARPKIWRAGLVPYYITDRGTVEMMFMIPSDQQYGGSDPQMAKGRIEEGESPRETSIREAKEELGLINANIDGEVVDLGVHLGRTHVFACRVRNRDLFGVFSFETADVVWMTEDEFRENGRDIHRDIVHMVECHAIEQHMDDIRERKQAIAELDR